MPGVPGPACGREFPEAIAEAGKGGLHEGVSIAEENPIETRSVSGCD